MKEHIHDILMRGRWFAGLPEGLQQFLISHGQLRTLQAGQRIFSRGDAPDGLYACISGSIQVAGSTRVGQEDKQTILTLIEAPDWFGEICLFDGLPRTHDATADTAATVLHVRYSACEQLFVERPDYWKPFGLLLTQKLRLMFMAMEDIALMPTPLRVVRRLLQMSQGYGIRAKGTGMLGVRTLNVSQEKLSAMLAISRQTTNQILKQLEGEGLIALHRGTIEITNFEGLHRKAEQEV